MKRISSGNYIVTLFLAITDYISQKKNSLELIFETASFNRKQLGVDMHFFLKKLKSSFSNELTTSRD